MSQMFSRKKRDDIPSWKLDFRATVEIPIYVTDIDFKSEVVQLRTCDQEVTVGNGEVIYLNVPYEKHHNV